jgi:hypothetical protein
MTTGSFGKIECTHCGGHIEYPEQAGGMSVACPHCQQTVALPAAMTSRPSKRRWGLLVAVLLGISLIGWGGWFAISRQAAASSGARPSVLPNPPPVDLQRMKQLAFWDFSIEQKEGSTIIHAVARVLNESSATRYGVEVRLELRDSLGRVIGTSRDYVERLEPNQDATIRALVVKRDAVSARLLDISEQ